MNINLRAIKYLPLPSYFTKYGSEHTTHGLITIKPIFHRNGYYLNRETNLTWIEKDGIAYKYRDRDAFELSLAINPSNNYLPAEVLTSLGILSSYGMLTNKQRVLYGNELLRYSIRASRIRIKLTIQKAKKCR